ncbi:HpcH/HpaI aldolase/citrate lyase family protein [Taklimakanibacter lacteus]|uniref:HpcH/HpaI aldolase/citrate lyase family protein n=1 Tax=Taklimakanibacter lacteus TaxID=2268456 RepID=UPI0013C43B1C
MMIAPLFVPADRPDRFAKAAESGADAIIVDLEDAVPPARKDEARGNLGILQSLPVPAFVRVNAEGTLWHEDDLAALVRLNIGMVCVPKVESAGHLDALLSRLGAGARLLAQIETAAGVSQVQAIAGHRAVTQLAFGPADFFLDLGIGASAEMASHVLCILALASRTAGIAAPLDGPCFSVSDQDLLARECANAASAGAKGKLCIHPAQISGVFSHFLPSDEELDWARRVSEADRDGGVCLIDGRMIDAPIVARAKAMLETKARRRGVMPLRQAP